MTASNSVVLREALILSANHLLAVRSLEATDDEVTSRHILEMLDECVVHGSPLTASPLIRCAAALAPDRFKHFWRD